ncbi:MAG: LysR family transcriptional regulator [Myxococcales bacterium]|nr:LysR family transcriptional regulator [Myxococcales bacterium]
MKIREMQLLVRVAETGSMTLAAQQLHLTPAAVSAAVQRIERALDVRLFERTTRSLHPTDEGLVILEGCQDVVARWQQAMDDASGHRHELEGTVHLSAPADTTYLVLQSVVGELCAAHPGLRVVIDTSDHVQPLHRDAIDMAIRYGPLQDSSLSARKLVEAPAILVAAPSYLDAHGSPRTPEELAAHRCLTLHRSNVPTVRWTLVRGEHTHQVDVDSPLCGDGYLARRWALAGMGIAFKSLFDVIDDLEQGGLLRVMPDVTGGTVAVHAVFPSRRFQPARVRTLDAAITQRFEARAARCRAWLQRG